MSDFAPRDGEVVLAQEVAALKDRLYELERVVAGLAGDEALPAAGLEVLVCRIGEGRVALPLVAVQEVVPVAATAPLPEAPIWVQGLLDLRGEAVPVLDVAARIDRRQSKVAISDQVVVCRERGRSLGLLVHEVLGVQRFTAEDARGAGEADVPRAPWVRATLADTKGFVLLLSIGRLAATSDLPVAEAPGGRP